MNIQKRIFSAVLAIGTYVSCTNGSENPKPNNFFHNIFIKAETWMFDNSNFHRTFNGFTPKQSITLRNQRLVLAAAGIATVNKAYNTYTSK